MGTKPKSQLIELLRETAPAFAKWRPLAIGIFDQVRLAYPDWPVRQVWLALTRWINSAGYQVALAKPDARRLNLDGSDAGPVSEEHREHAQQRAAELLAQRKAKSAARRAQREAEKAAAERKAAQLAAEQAKAERKAAEARKAAGPSGARRPVITVKKRRSVDLAGP